MSEDPLLDLRAASGFIEAAVAEELPGLRLDWLTIEAQDGASDPALRARLRRLSDRERGATVVAMRTKPVPAAYRTFFRQIGLDPDTTRPPAEEVAVSRLFHGAFRSQGGRVADALLVALIETGVPVWALDADHVAPGGPGIRTARAGERPGAAGTPLSPGTLVIADARSVHAVLFGERAVEGRVSRRTRRILLYAVGVAGVPAIHIEEAFWLAAEALQGRG